MPEQMYAWEPESLLNYLTRVVNATAAERELAANFIQPDNDGDSDVDTIYHEDDDGAHIQVSGPLSMKGPSGLARLFGLSGTSYKAIQGALDRARASAADNVTLHVSSPGGEVAGVDETWQAIRSLAREKNVVARVEGMCASAAYWLASACNSIEATSPAAEVGSIGVKMVTIDDSSAAQKAGFKRVQILSKNAPNKSDDVSTKTGRAALQDRVDAAERVFISRVAEGRGVSSDTVKERFGRGGLVLAEDPDHDEPDALSAGMIDRVVPFTQAHVGPMGPGYKQTRPRGSAEENESERLAGACGKEDWPIVDKPWGGDDAVRRWQKYSGSEKHPSSTYKDGCFWYDEKKKDTFGAYKLHFVDIVDGKPAAIKIRISQCQGMMHGAREGVNVPSKDRHAVEGRINHYLDRIKKMDKKKKSEASYPFGILPLTAPYPNEHACRMAAPGGFKKFSTQKGKDDQKIKGRNYKPTGKPLEVIIGYKKSGGSQVESYRYDKSTWSAAEARRHCEAHGGKFEPARQGGNNDKDTKKGSAFADRGASMTLIELLESNPEAKAELEQLKAEAFEQGVSSVQARVDAAKPFLALDVTEKGYTQAEADQIAKIAVDVIAGDEDVSTMKSFLRLIDMQAEARKGASAGTDADGKDIPKETPPAPSADTTIQEAIAKLGEDRVAQIKSYCEANGVDLVGSLKAEMENLVNAGGKR